MMSANANTSEKRGGLAVITEMLELTRKMSGSEDADFLIRSIDIRGELMHEYDTLKKNPTASADIEKHKPQISKMIDEMIGLDKKINRVMDALYRDAKAELQSTTQKNKVLNYTNHAISQAGSYMDYKE